MIRVDYIFYVEKYHGRLIDDEESLKLPVLKANTTPYKTPKSLQLIG